MLIRRAASALAVLVFLTASLGVPTPVLAVKTLGISTPTFDFNVAAGDSGHGECTVINDGTEPISVLVYSANQKIDANGKITYEAPKLDGGDFLNSPALWLRLKVPEDTKAIGNTPYLELAPKQQIPVEFAFSVPKGVPPGDHQIIIFFEMFDLEQAASGRSSKIGARVGSRIRLRVAGQFDERIDVRPFVAREFVVGDRVPWTFVIRNDGNLDKDVMCDIVVRDSNEADVLSKNIAKDLAVYARTTLPRSGTLTLPANALGRFTVVLTTTYSKEGQSQPTEVVKERTIWAVPLWIAIVIIAVLGVIALWLSWRSAVRSAERKAKRREAKEAQRREEETAAMLEDESPPPERAAASWENTGAPSDEVPTQREDGW